MWRYRYRGRKGKKRLSRMNEKVEESQGKDTVEIHSVKYKEKKGGKEETEGEDDCGRN